MLMKHENDSGACLKCANIFNHYAGFSEELRTWFEAVQLENPDAHISCAGRGMVDQEEAVQRGASQAHWLQSAHNFNAALDIFQLKDGTAFWTPAWFLKVVHSNLYPNLEWYGEKTAKFYELPHVQMRAWKELLAKGILHPVE